MPLWTTSVQGALRMYALRPFNTKNHTDMWEKPPNRLGVCAPERSPHDQAPTPMGDTSSPAVKPQRSSVT